MKGSFFRFVILTGACFWLQLVHSQAGQPDDSFGTAGSVKYDISNSGFFNQNKGSLIFSDQKIVTVALMYGSGTPSLGMLGLLANGSIDSSFGINGKLIEEFYPNGINIMGIAKTQDDRIIVMGYRTENTDYFPFLLKYKRNGIRDSSFGTNGYLQPKVKKHQYISPVSACSLSNGDILVGGWAYDSFYLEFVFKIHSDGSMDASFSDGDGYVEYAESDQGSMNIMVIQKDEKILISRTLKSTEYGIRRLNADGGIDSNFGTNGDLFCGSNPFGTLAIIGVQDDGKILHTASLNDILRISRFNVNGSTDLNFGNKGSIDVPTLSAFLSPVSINLQKDKKILISGLANINNGAEFIIRLDSLGQRDMKFGAGGVVIGSFVTDDGFTVVSTGIQSDNKMIISAYNNSGNIALMRINLENKLVIPIVFPAGNLLVYPNPASRNVKVLYYIKTAGVYNLELLDLNGKIIQKFEENYWLVNGKYIRNFSLPAHLSQGVYVVRLRTDKEVKQQKLMVE